MEIKKFNELSKETLDKIINKHFNHWSQYSEEMTLENTIDKFKNIYAKNNETTCGLAMLN